MGGQRIDFGIETSFAKELAYSSERAFNFHLPTVCRQIYSESAILGYETNIFEFIAHSSHTQRWRARDLAPAQRNAITDVSAPWFYVSNVFQLPGAASRIKEWFPNVKRVYVDESSVEPPAGITKVEMAQDIRDSVKRKENQDVKVIFYECYRADNILGRYFY